MVGERVVSLPEWCNGLSSSLRFWHPLPTMFHLFGFVFIIFVFIVAGYCRQICVFLHLHLLLVTFCVCTRNFQVRPKSVVMCRDIGFICCKPSQPHAHSDKNWWILDQQKWNVSLNPTMVHHVLFRWYGPKKNNWDVIGIMDHKGYGCSMYKHVNSETVKFGGSRCIFMCFWQQCRLVL